MHKNTSNDFLFHHAHTKMRTSHFIQLILYKGISEGHDSLTNHHHAAVCQNNPAIFLNTFRHQQLQSFKTLHYVFSYFMYAENANQPGSLVLEYKEGNN